MIVERSKTTTGLSGSYRTLTLEQPIWDRGERTKKGPQNLFRFVFWFQDHMKLRVKGQCNNIRSDRMLGTSWFTWFAIWPTLKHNTAVLQKYFTRGRRCREVQGHCGRFSWCCLWRAFCIGRRGHDLRNGRCKCCDGGSLSAVFRSRLHGNSQSRCRCWFSAMDDICYVQLLAVRITVIVL